MENLNQEWPKGQENKKNDPRNEKHEGVESQAGEVHKQEEENPDREHKIDDQLDQSFPASDPPSYSQPGNEMNEDANKGKE